MLYTPYNILMSNAAPTANHSPVIAATIARQIGGNRAFVMLGATSKCDHGNALSFKFKGCKTANVIKITLAADDTSIVELRKFSLRTLKDTHEREFHGVYADSLVELIERETGLFLSLGGKVVFL